MLIICDFDGTVTERDVTDLIWDDFYDGDWRADLLPSYDAGETSILEVMGGGYRRVRRSPEELLGHVRDRVRLRPGFERLAEVAEEHRWDLRVLSCGLEFYIRALLPDGIPYDCFVGEYGSGWRVTLPMGVDLVSGEDFKMHVLAKLRASHEGKTVVYVGDGRNDFPAARTCDLVFAVRGSTLASLCLETGVPFSEFTHFDEVIRALVGA
jgi:2-hydroxy-3-keto-5-methylthiopentenyl-1-phosphate phosphatase